ncbi:MAG TPA: transposase [Verrucomicrobiae bacterium]|nr:transposase [Verrucomicrobiae bacterium]
MPRLNYAAPHAYSLTLCTHERREVFKSAQTAETVLSILRECADEFRYDLLAYCLMPDHLHLLISPQDSGVTVSEFVRHLKSRSAFRFKSATHEKLWQRGFYDHAVRKSEDLQKVADYIFHNPVRKGLVETAEAYPYAGPKA